MGNDWGEEEEELGGSLGGSGKYGVAQRESVVGDRGLREGNISGAKLMR